MIDGGVAWSSGQGRSLSLQGLRVRIPSPTFPFEECIVRVEKKMKKKEEEEEEEDREHVNREERGRRPWH